MIDAFAETIKVVLVMVAIILIIWFVTWLFYFQYDSAVPVTGCVVAKIEVGCGYNHCSVHVLKLDVGAEMSIYITTSARVYNVVAERACYEFTGPRSGQSYDGARVVEVEK